MHLRDNHRVVTQQETGFFQHHHKAVDQSRITALVRQVLINLLKSEVPAVGRLGDHRLKRIVESMHVWTPSLEFTSAQLPSAAADVP
jgi:hypothetical protein